MNTFSNFRGERADLADATRCAARDVLRLREGESVLIITNPEWNVADISFSLYDASLEAGACPVLIFQDRKSQFDYAEDAVIAALENEPEVIISLSHGKIGRDRKAELEPYLVDGTPIDHIYSYLIEAKRIRGFWSPGVTVDMFAKTVPINYAELKSRAHALKRILDDATELEITSPLGTEIRVGINGRTAFTDDGDFSSPGMGGNLPAGETFISPALGTAEGTIVFDGSITLYSGDFVIDTPIEVDVSGGHVTDIRGGDEAKRLLETVTLAEDNAVSMEKEGKLPTGKGAEYRINARNIGEVGIGLNPAVEITGNMLGDEKVLRTCHFAIGSNYDDDAPALIHLDGLVSLPTITALMSGGGRMMFMKEGDLVL